MKASVLLQAMDALLPENKTVTDRIWDWVGATSGVDILAEEESLARNNNN